MKLQVLLNKKIVENVIDFSIEKNTITYIDEKTHFPYITTTIQCEQGEITWEEINE